jgi:choline dehydrogenase-like flavoprotein
LKAFLDARSIPTGTSIDTDLAIIGGGPAGISLALALAGSPIRMMILESGGQEFETDTQALYKGSETGVRYIPLDATRLRYLGGSSNHWGGWCRPLDEIDFEKRDWLPHSGWPIRRKDIEPYFDRAQQLCGAGPFIYDDTDKWAAALGAPVQLGSGGLYTTFMQFSKQPTNYFPVRFGEQYSDQLKRIPNLDLMLHANVTGLRLASNAASVDHLDVATLTGKRFTVRPKYVVLAVGGIENPRLLLASNDVMTSGIGNENGMVGRFFADHPIPGDTATLVLFNGTLAPYYQNPQTAYGANLRAAFAPKDAYKRTHNVLGSLATVEAEVQLDALGQAAVTTTAGALGVDARNMRAFTLGCGLELAPDPNRHVSLTTEQDALGMPRLKLDMRISDNDFMHYRQTLLELGRQLMESRIGMLRINHHSRDSWLSVMDWGNHHMGATRMHDDPKRGVVDANLQVHGVNNLFVAGSSVFPTYSASNPTLNLIALTLRLADRLRQAFGK